jgi:predicted Zn-dependent protease
MSTRKWLALLPLALICAPPAAEAKSSRPRAISEKAQAKGAQAHPELLQEFGGAYTGPTADYVAGVDRRVAVQSGIVNSESAYTITLLNSNVLNAFAIPGGYVYVTRQLLAAMNDEAELAFVLGHEVGHVAARHSKKRQTSSTIGNLGAVLLGAVTGSSQIAGLASQAGQVLLLGYSRDQEYQADSLGVRYLGGAGYDRLAAPDMLQQLGNATQLEGLVQGKAAESTPGWARSHPLTADRVARARALAEQLGPASSPLRNRDAFLDAIDGMIYDDDPSQGLVDGRSFRHPGLGIGFEAPAGYAIANGSDAVTISGSEGQAQFAGGAYSGSLESRLDSLFRQIGNGQVNYGQPRRVTIGGFEGLAATAQGASGQTRVDVTILAFRTATDQALHFITVTRAGAGIGPFRAMLDSFRRLSPAEIGSARARRVQIVTLQPADTLESLAGRMAYADHRLERFKALNGLAARPETGTRVKLIVYDWKKEARPASAAAAS